MKVLEKATPGKGKRRCYLREWISCLPVIEKSLFFFLLILYGSIIFINADNELIGDEPRYLMFAKNLLEGYYSPESTLNLANGPGYPLVLIPLVWLGWSLIYGRLLNALFLLGSFVFFYKTIQFYLPRKVSLWVSLPFAFYLPFFKELHFFLTEELTLFSVGGFIYFFCQWHQPLCRRWYSFPLTVFFLGYLAMTKIFFGYVLSAGLVISILIHCWKRSGYWKGAAGIFVSAFILCIPYLVYTFSLTGKLFYWANSGGLSLYCMSSPYPQEWGDWFYLDNFKKSPSLSRNHQPFFSLVLSLPPVERDTAFKKKAIENIIQYPTKFLINWMANMGRLLFNFPYSYTPQKLSTFFYVLPNMFLVVLTFFSLYPACRGYRLIPLEVYELSVFGLIAFLGSSVISGWFRQFLPIFPFAYLWLVVVFYKTLRFDLRI